MVDIIDIFQLISVWSVRSCCQLNTLLQHVLKIFRESLPHAHISERWAQIALQLGLSCSSRHYAGRSLQVLYFIILLHLNIIILLIIFNY